MKTVVALLLLCLCDPGRSDCQTDCLSCSHILPRGLGFNTMVCLLECKGNVSPSVSWNVCHAVISSPISSLDGTLKKRSQEEAEALFSKEQKPTEGDLILPVALQRFDHVTRALGISEKDLGYKSSELNAAYDSQNALSVGDEYEEEAEAGRGLEDAGGAPRGQDDAELSVSKRFGGFVKGRHSYRRLMSPGRSYQKRYGGFIGIRKSARKWNNQKRFSEFLKQYLGMSSKATGFNSVSDDLNRQNEV